MVFCFYFFEARADNLTTSNCSTDGSTNFITGDTCASGSHTQSTVNVFDSQPTGTATTGGFSNMTQTGSNAHIKNWTYKNTGLTPELWFQHTQDRFAIELAITQALAGTGLKVDGYTSRWKVNNTRTNTIGGNCTVAKTNNQCVDPLTITIEAKDSNGTVIHTDSFDYGGMNTLNITPGAPDPHWFQQTVLSWVGTGQLTPGTDIASVGISIAGYDAGYWQGNYGPRVKELEGNLILSQDICAINPLHSTNCSGYATAYATQQYNSSCSANPLYDSGCPGYSTAYFNQQCSANPLYDSSCNGYATAHYNQQCTADALYDSGCPGYANALAQQQYNQSCSADPLYDSGCPGYATAYFNQQCSANALHDSSCPGYATAYYNQQCSASALYDSGCPGYATAYYNQQCSASALYDSGCPGYATAYFNQQCGISALYDSSCPGYATAYFNQQCTASALYDSSCPGYATAYFNQQCGISALHDSTCPGYATAYFNQQCGISALHDTTCPGYAQAYFSQQCTISGLYDTTCPNYETAYFDNQCTLDSTYNPACPGYAVAIVVEDATGSNDGVETAEEIAEDTSTIINAETITNVAITGDAIVDAVINEEPSIVIVPTTEEPIMTQIVQVEEIVVPVEIAEVSAFDTTVVIETFDTFIDKGPVIAPLASIAQIEQVQEVQQLETFITSIENEVEMEIAQLEIVEPDTNEEVQLDAEIVEPVLEVEVEATTELIEEENKEEETIEVAVKEEEVKEDEPESTESETTDEAVESKEDAESTKEKEEVVKEKEIVVAEKPKSKKIVMTKEQKAKAKAKKMKEIIKNKLAGLAVDLSKATSLKQQAEIQAQISALINFIPGFNAYGGQVQVAGDFYGSDSIYIATKVPENQRGLLNGLASQIKHEAMVDMQYKN